MLTILRARTLQLYVLREFVRVFLLALLACSLFMLLALLFIAAREWEEYGVTTAQVAVLFVYLLPKPVAWAVPVAAMIAATLVFGRLTAENEILAVQSGGAPIRALVLPLILCSVLLSGFSLWCNESGLTWGYTIIRNEILKPGKPEAVLKRLQKEGSSFGVKQSDGSVVKINMLPHKTNPETGEVERPIHIAFLKDNQVGNVIIAADHKYEPRVESQNERILALTLRDAQTLGKNPLFTSSCMVEIRLPQLDTIINIGDARGQQGWWQNYQEAAKIRRSIKERRIYLLQRAADFGAQAVAASPADPGAMHLATATWSDARVHSEAMYGSGGAYDRIRGEQTECQRKLALSLLPISMTILGIGLGLLVQKSQRLVGFFVGLGVYALVYYPMAIITKEIVSAGLAPVWLQWLPNVLLLIGGYALWRAYEHGWLTDAPAWLVALGPNVGGFFRQIFAAMWRPFAELRDWAAGRLSSKLDGYVAASFAVPLLLVVLCVAALFIALDLVEHGNMVIAGLTHASERIKERTVFIAALDVVTFYAIVGLEWICDLLPVLILLAATLCVYVLVRNNEHLILKASGVSLQRAFRPIIVIAVLFSIGVTTLRETFMPRLILRRDRLKPLVYNRVPYPAALALHTTDGEGKPVLFQISQYSSLQREGRDLRVYLGTDARDRNIPAIVADKATWDGEAWRLQTDPNKGVTDPTNATAPNLPLQDKGLRVRRDGPEAGQAEREPAKITKTRLDVWRGGVTPAIIESERLGPGVMGLTELYASSGIKRDFSIELWRRGLEVVMGLLLLWAALPLLLREETRRPLVGVLLCILLGAAYWALNLGVAEVARQQILPTWAPVLPHAAFLLLGSWQYYFALDT